MTTSDLFDLAIVIIVIVFAIRGYQKGLINQLGALVSMIAGIVISVRYTPMLAAQLPGNDKVKFICAFVLLLLAVTLVVWGVVNALSHIIDNLKLNAWNNQMGAALGLFYGVFCSVALTFVLLVYAVPVSTIVVDENGNQVEKRINDKKSFISQSRIGPKLTIVMLGMIDYLPKSEDCKYYDDLREYLRQNANSIKESNPDLPKEPLQILAPSESEQDDDKPRLPLSPQNSPNP